MMVVDLMHEFELGVWKVLFTHLIRILHAASNRPGALVDLLNTRYAQLYCRGERANITCTDSARFPRLAGLQYGAFTTTSRR
jgi:hypothetical protein